jgi:hypothetical protein
LYFVHLVPRMRKSPALVKRSESIESILHHFAMELGRNHQEPLTLRFPLPERQPQAG